MVNRCGRKKSSREWTGKAIKPALSHSASKGIQTYHFFALIAVRSRMMALAMLYVWLSMGEYGMHKCTTCGKSKPASAYRTQINRNNERRKQCMECGLASHQKWRDKNKDYMIRKRYGIDIKEYRRILSTQNGLCGICRGKDSGNKTKKYCVDHCHSTKVVRGLLCRHCNLMLGHAKDDKKILKMAVKYLEKKHGK